MTIILFSNVQTLWVIDHLRRLPSLPGSFIPAARATLWSCVLPASSVAQCPSCYSKTPLDPAQWLIKLLKTDSVRSPSISTLWTTTHWYHVERTAMIVSEGRTTRWPPVHQVCRSVWASSWHRCWWGGNDQGRSSLKQYMPLKPSMGSRCGLPQTAPTTTSRSLRSTQERSKPLSMG